MESTNKVRYTDVDRRRNLDMLGNYGLDSDFIQTVKECARSVACLVLAGNLIEKNGGYAFPALTTTLSEYCSEEFENIYGENEFFGNEINPGFGTAFLVGDQLALTAAHCVCSHNTNELNQEKIKATRLVFNFKATQQKGSKREFPIKSVYKISQVVGHLFSRGKVWSDWALLKLDREAQGLTPLKVNFAKISPQMKFFILGHPSGLPIKYTGDGNLKKEAETCFESDIDAYAGNSGAPVFDTHSREVVGILCTGNTDYEVVDNYNGTGQRRTITHQATVEEIKIHYEGCQKISVLGVVQKHILTSPVAGLNIQITCDASQCSVFKERVFIHKKFGTFDIGKEASRSLLPCCSTSAYKVDALVIKNCRYSYRGVNQKEISVEQKDQVVQQGTIVLDLSGWKFCSITIEKNI